MLLLTRFLSFTQSIILPFVFFDLGSVASVHDDGGFATVCNSMSFREEGILERVVMHKTILK